MCEVIKTLVSIIVPVYNVENYLEKSLDSILRQTHKNIEIIVVNDGSTDKSREILTKYEKKYYYKLIVYDKDNGGLSSARNYGIERAKGDYIAFVDSDDTIDENMISEMVEKICEYDCDIAMCGRYDIYNKKQIEKYSLNNPWILNSEEVLKNMLIRNKMDFAACDKLYRKELWQNIRFPEGKNHEDMYTIPYIIRKSKKIIHVGKPYYHYFHREGSLTTTVNEKRVRDYYSAVHSISKIINDSYNNINKEYIFFMNNSYLMLLLLINKASEKNKQIMNIEYEANKYLQKNWNNRFSLNLMTRQRRIMYFLIKHSLYDKLTKVKIIFNK